MRTGLALLGAGTLMILVAIAITYGVKPALIFGLATAGSLMVIVGFVTLASGGEW